MDSGAVWVWCSVSVMQFVSTEVVDDQTSYTAVGAQHKGALHDGPQLELRVGLFRCQAGLEDCRERVGWLQHVLPAVCVRTRALPREK